MFKMLNTRLYHKILILYKSYTFYLIPYFELFKPRIYLSITYRPEINKRYQMQNQLGRVFEPITPYEKMPIIFMEKCVYFMILCMSLILLITVSMVYMCYDIIKRTFYKNNYF